MFTITDDSGFLALIDPDAYQGFVGSEWDFEELIKRFRTEMHNRHLLIWGTGMEMTWRVKVSFEPVSEIGSRVVAGSIHSVAGRLLVTNYESLTMAAQFADVTLPEPRDIDDLLSLEPGSYTCRIIQVADYDDDTVESSSPLETNDVHYIIELLRTDEPLPAWKDIPWSVVA